MAQPHRAGPAGPGGRLGSRPSWSGNPCTCLAPCIGKLAAPFIWPAASSEERLCFFWSSKAELLGRVLLYAGRNLSWYLHVILCLVYNCCQRFLHVGCSLVKKDAGMLDAFGKGASDDIQAAKAELYAQVCKSGFMFQYCRVFCFRV